MQRVRPSRRRRRPRGKPGSRPARGHGPLRGPRALPGRRVPVDLDHAAAIVGEDGAVVGRVAGWRDIDSEVEATGGSRRRASGSSAPWPTSPTTGSGGARRTGRCSTSRPRASGSPAIPPRSSSPTTTCCSRITHPDDRERMLDHYANWRPSADGDVGHDLEYRIRRRTAGALDRAPLRASHGATTAPTWESGPATGTSPTARPPRRSCATARPGCRRGRRSWMRC